MATTMAAEQTRLGDCDSGKIVTTKAARTWLSASDSGKISTVPGYLVG